MNRIESFCQDFDHEKISRNELDARNFAKFTRKHLCQNLFFKKVAGLRPAALLKKTLIHVFSREFCEIVKNTFFTQHLLTSCLTFSI